ncbi:MAG: hypothetical protein M0T80_10135 [Actinomycetota bacterium]|nr:hypothetical protein [Actinomycetota bacterium]
MGLMDKVKSQAAALAEMAQEGARVGQERLTQMQSKRQADALLLEYGGLVYLQRAGRGDPGTDARLAEITTQIAAFEAANGPIQVTPAVPPPGATGSYVPGGTAPTPPGATGSYVPGGTAPTPPGATGSYVPGAAASASPAGAAPSSPAPPAGDGQAWVTPPPPPPAGGAGGIPSGSYSSDQDQTE